MSCPTQSPTMMFKSVCSRVMYPEVPPRVEYSLTEYGKGLFPVFESIRAWGLNYLENEGIAVKKC